MRHESMPTIIVDDETNNYISEILNLNQLFKKEQENTEYKDEPIRNTQRQMPLVIFLDGKLVKGNQIELKDENSNHTVQVYYEL